MAELRCQGFVVVVLFFLIMGNQVADRHQGRGLCVRGQEALVCVVCGWDQYELGLAA